MLLSVCLTRIRRLPGIAFACACAVQPAAAAFAISASQRGPAAAAAATTNSTLCQATPAAACLPTLHLACSVPRLSRACWAAAKWWCARPPATAASAIHLHTHPCPSRLPRRYRASLRPPRSALASTAGVLYPMTPTMHNPIDTSITLVCSCSPPPDLDEPTQARILQRASVQRYYCARTA